MTTIDTEKMTPDEYLQHLQHASAGGVKNFQRIIQYVKQRETRENMENWIKTASLTETEKEFLRKNFLEPYQAVTNDLSYSHPSQTDQSFDFVLKPMSRAIENSAQELKFKIPENTKIGTVFTRQVNACAIKIPSGGSLVVVNQGTFMFIHLFAKIIASLFPVVKNSGGQTVFSTKIEDIEKEIEANKEANERFVEILFCYLVLGDPYRAQQYFQLGPPKLIADSLRNVAELFIIAHEYSHLILKHNEESNLTSFLMGDVEAKQYERSKNNEFQADMLGLWLTIHAQPGTQKDFKGAYVGLDFFFSTIDLIEKILGLEANETHPSAKARRAFLRMEISMGAGLMKQFIPIRDIPPELAKSAINLSETIQHVVNMLWERNKVPFYNKVYQFGVPPTITLY
jgi:hypothetical protein